MATKQRWSEEESRLLARKEAELTGRGVKFLNQELAIIFPERTLESIKGKRKQTAYKQLVSSFLETEDIGDGAGIELNEDPEQLAYDEAIIEYLNGLPPVDSNKYNPGRLTQLCEGLRQRDRGAMLEELTLYLREVFPPQQRIMRAARNRQPETKSKKQVRRAEYARTQDLWKKNRSKCLRMLLDDLSDAKPPPKDVMVPFWETVMTVHKDTSPGLAGERPAIGQLWTPITPDEIKKSMPANTTSAGPDGLTARTLKGVPAGILCRIFNLFMYCRRAPSYLLESLTTLIPKKPGAVEPSDFRPITVSAVLMRAFHKVLATRLSKQVKFDQRQRAFRPTDGCSDNVFLLDMVLRDHHARHKSLFVASLDIAKAFDSVAHSTIRDTLRVMGLPPPLVEYIMSVYSDSTTRLCCDRWTSDIIKPKCGVKQGDPMSPVIFNMIIERLLNGLSEDIGAKIGQISVNAAAFADDMLLFASTPRGLQQSIDHCTEFLSKCGLKVNAAKCFTVALRNVPHDKKTVVDAETVFLCQGNALPALKRSDQWRYLGIPFTPEGRVKIDATSKLHDAIMKLTKAPLKPQQRLFAMRTMVLPAIYYQLELGSTSVSILRKCDRLVRQAVRGWLGLPSDTVNAYIHASVKDGGLGIPSVRWNAPLRRYNRLRKLPITNENSEVPNAFLNRELQRCHTRLHDSNEQLETLGDIEKKWARLLHVSVDGSGLKESRKVPQQHTWQQDGTRFLSGRDFVMSNKLRINALPTRARTSRGRIRERLCRGGCHCSETLNHVLQICHRTHGPRIKRHDAVAAYIARALRAGDYAVFEEPRIRTELGLRKPDIIAKLGRTAMVIDAQVVNDQLCLDTAHETKSNTYRDLEEIIKREYQVAEVKFTSATLSWRGVWSKASAESLLELGVIRTKALRVISSRVIIGGIAAFRQFNRTTAVG